MMHQPELFSPLTSTDFDVWVHTDDGRIITNNFIKLAWRLHKRGWKHYGAKAIIEKMRFDYKLKVGPDADGFKLNNNWTSRLARFAMEREPRLQGFFELRELK